MSENRTPTNANHHHHHHTPTHPAFSSCEEVLALLSDYVDGLLSPDLCTALEEHFEQCPDCFVVVDSLRKMLILYRRLEPPTLPKQAEMRLFRVLNLEDFLEPSETEDDATG